MVKWLTCRIGYLCCISQRMVQHGAHSVPLPLPRLRRPRPMPLPARPLVESLRPTPRPVCPPTPTYPVVVVDVEVPRGRVPLPLPLVAGFGGPASALLRSSSAFLAAASLRACSSAARRSTACFLWLSSSSMSSTSCVAPCHCGFRMSRWLCSVWERMRVHVWRSVEAFWTVLDTVWQRQYAKRVVVPRHSRPCCPWLSAGSRPRPR